MKERGKDERMKYLEKEERSKTVEERDRFSHRTQRRCGVKLA